MPNTNTNLTVAETLQAAIDALHACPELETVYNHLEAVLCRLDLYHPEVARELVTSEDYFSGDIMQELRQKSQNADPATQAAGRTLKIVCR
jgi:hypothetical protein